MRRADIKRIFGILAALVAIALCSVIGFGVYQRQPAGGPLRPSGRPHALDGLAPGSGVLTEWHRFKDRTLVIGNVDVEDKDLPALEKAQVLDLQLPGLKERIAKDRENSASGAAATDLAAGHQEIASMLLSAGLQGGKRSVIFDGETFRLLASISADTGVKLVATPQGQTLYLVTSTIRKATPDQPGTVEDRFHEQPTAWDTFRSQDHGKTWQYDADVVLDSTLNTVFLTQSLGFALDNRGLHEASVLHTADQAHTWSATPLQAAVWPDTEEFRRNFDQGNGAQTETHGEAQLHYEWSLYPLDASHAIGWSWRLAFDGTPGTRERVVDMRRFEVEFSGDDARVIHVAKAEGPVPRSQPDTRFDMAQPIYAIDRGSTIYLLDKTTLEWRRMSSAPVVHGTQSRIGQAWHVAGTWVIRTYADHWFSFGNPTTDHFYSRDQGQTWHAFRLTPRQDYGLLGLDARGRNLLIQTGQDDRILIVPYSLR
jgi:hypothetical protein